MTDSSEMTVDDTTQASFSQTKPMLAAHRSISGQSLLDGGQYRATVPAERFGGEGPGLHAEAAFTNSSAQYYPTFTYTGGGVVSCFPTFSDWSGEFGG